MSQQSADFSIDLTRSAPHAHHDDARAADRAFRARARGTGAGAGPSPYAILRGSDRQPATHTAAGRRPRAHAVGIHKSIAFLALVPIGIPFIGAQKVMGPDSARVRSPRKENSNEQVQGASPGRNPPLNKKVTLDLSLNKKVALDLVDCRRPGGAFEYPPEQRQIRLSIWGCVGIHKSIAFLALVPIGTPFIGAPTTPGSYCDLFCSQLSRRHDLIQPESRRPGARDFSRNLQLPRRIHRPRRPWFRAGRASNASRRSSVPASASAATAGDPAAIYPLRRGAGGLAAGAARAPPGRPGPTAAAGLASFSAAAGGLRRLLDVGPERPHVPSELPAPQQPVPICVDFANGRHCKWGHACKYRHRFA